MNKILITPFSRTELGLAIATIFFTAPGEPFRSPMCGFWPRFGAGTTTKKNKKALDASEINWKEERMVQEMKQEDRDRQEWKYMHKCMVGERAAQVHYLSKQCHP